MNHNDAAITDVMVVLDCSDPNAVDGVVANLKTLGLQIDNVDTDNNVVEGSIDSARVHSLNGVACVRYVRSVFSYIADYPPGDPPDQDGTQDSSDGDEE